MAVVAALGLDQRLAAFAFQALKSGLNARHQNWIPDFSATVCMSLSPRPERLTSRIASFDIDLNHGEACSVLMVDTYQSVLRGKCR